MDKEFEVVKQAAEQALENETKVFSVLNFAKHLEAASEAYRYDTVIRTINEIVQKKAATNPGGLITAEEILGLYRHVHGLNLQSKFADVCKDYLPKVVEVVDDSATKVAASRDVYFDDGVRSLEKKAEAPAVDVALTPSGAIDVAALTDSIEATVEDGMAKAVSQFKVDTVKLAYDIAKNELTALGYALARMHLRSSDTKGVIFAADIQTADGKFSIDLPVEIAADQVLLPTEFKHEGKSFAFSRKGFTNFLAGNKNAVSAVKYSSEFVDMSYNDLKKTIHQAVLDRNYTRAEEALALIQDKFGDDTHKTAVMDYQDMLKEASQDYEKRCSGCPYYGSSRSIKATHAEDYCNLVRESCKRVTKTAAGICVRSSVEFDRIHDKEYQSSAAISNSKVFLT